MASSNHLAQGVLVNKPCSAKRRHLFVAGGAALATMLTACTSSSSKSTSPSVSASAVNPTQTSAQCSGTPKTGGTITAGRQNETLTADIYQGHNWGDGEAANMLYKGLVQMDPSGKTDDIQGAVSDKWTISDDGLKYSFHIRDGVKFSNGDPVTAQDIKDSIERSVDPKQDPGGASNLAPLKAVRVVSDSQVELDLKAPSGGLLYALSLGAAAIFPTKLLASQGDKFWDNPVGTGPFKLGSFVKGSSITFVKNPYYWVSGLPRVDKVVWNFTTDDNARVLGLEGNQTELIDSVPVNQVNEVKGKSGLSVMAAKIPSWVLLEMNQQKPQFKDANVRQALSLAIDRASINSKIWEGVGTVPNSVLPAGRYDADASKVPAFGYDVNKAKQLMSQSKFASGFSATLEYPGGNPQYEALALALQQEWQQIGIKITLKAEDAATLGKSQTGAKYDLILPYALAVANTPIPDQFAGYFAGVGGATASLNNFFSWAHIDPSLTAKVQKFMQTSDDSSRAQQWPAIQAALNQALPAINVLDLPYLIGASDKVCDNTLTPIGYSSFLYTWLAS
jgi:peptide/nickel transport system substrate-binding protein